jgi:zinc transport system permease protein
MIEILQYPFFQNAILWWVLISCISSLLWVFVILRKEANIAHAISNFIFLGIALSLFFSWNYYWYGFVFAMLWAILISFIENTQFISKESTKEIISQAGIGGGIFLTWFLGNLQLDIFNFLFWSILFISKWDIGIISLLVIVWYIWFFLFWKNFLAVIFSEDVAKSKGIPTTLYNSVFLLFLSLFIWIGIKIFWILLIGAFLVIPANIGKVLGSSLKWVFIISFFISLFSVLVWLFGSYYLETFSGPTIVVLLIIFFIFSILYKKTRT